MHLEHSFATTFGITLDKAVTIIMRISISRQDDIAVEHAADGSDTCTADVTGRVNVDSSTYATADALASSSDPLQAQTTTLNLTADAAGALAPSDLLAQAYAELPTHPAFAGAKVVD